MARLFDRGQSARDERITLLAVRNGLSQSRLGVAVSTRHGGAVVRSRKKRLIRESFRLIRPDLPGGLDYVVLPRPGKPLTIGALQDSLRRLATQVARRVNEANGEAES